MNTRGFNLTIQFRDKDNNIKEYTEFHTNEQGARAALSSFTLKHGIDNVLGYSVDPRKNHLELKKEKVLPQRSNAYAKIK